MQIEYQEKWKYLSEACLNITDDCNLACHYCFVQQQPHYMNLQTAKDAADWLYNNAQIKIQKNIVNKDYKPRINFFGGEPTLLWDEIIEPLTKYIRQKYQNNFKISITTNGTLLTQDRINFMYNNNFGILLSMDGDKYTQDLTRPCQNINQSSFDLLMPHIPLLLKYWPQLTFRATINQENVDQMFHNFLFAEKIGFHEIFFSPNEREKWSEENLQMLELQVEKIYYYHYLQYILGIKPKLNSTLIDNGYYHAFKYFIAKSDNKNVNKDNIYNIYADRCGLGTNYGSINYEGKIFGCQEQDSRLNSNSIFEIGSIYKGVNKEKQLQLVNLYLKDTIKECENTHCCHTCKIYDACALDMCPSTSFDLYKNLKLKTEVLCRYKNAFANNSFIMINQLYNNELFNNYLTNLLTTGREGEKTYNGYK